MKSEVVWMESGFLGKNDPLWKDFENFVAKGFMRTRKHVLCANFVKFAQPEVGEIPRCLHDKKIGKRSSSRLCVDRAQNLSCTVKYFQ